MLDNIILFSIKNKVIIGIVTLLLIVWGVWSATKLPIDAVPDITNNQVQIITVCPTLAGQEVEQLVTFPIEQSIANIPGLEETRSISRFGLSVITIVFRDDIDIYFARQLINEKLKQAEEKIPEGIGKPELAPVSTGLGEVYQYIIHPKKGSENKYNPKDLRTMQDWIVARQLYGTPGVAEVNSFGGELKQYEVALNPNRLQALDISIPEVFISLEQNNQNTGGAYIDKKPHAYFIRGIGLATSLEDIENIAIKNRAGVPVYIKDVAKVRYGNAVRYGALSYNGTVDAVGGVVMMLKGENSNEVVNRVKEKLPTIQKSLPHDIIIEPYLDRTDLVGKAIGTVQKNLIEGALIVIFVLVLFLGNLRAGLIVASAIPLSMLFALALMNVFGVSANLMSLGAIDFGLIVDGSVIVVEATLHHLSLRKLTTRRTRDEMDNEVFQSATQIRNSAAFGEIIILIVYIPILTLIGIEGKMFRPMAQTVGFAIFGALILSLTYIPMMCSLFLNSNTKKNKTFNEKMMDFLHRIYQPILQKAISHKYIIVLMTTVAFIVSVILFTRIGGEFIPQLQEGDFAFHCILPQGSSLSQSIEVSMQASRIIKQFDEVKMVVGKTGAAEIPTDPMPPEATDMMIILKPQSEWKTEKSYTDLGNEMLGRLETVPGIFFEKNQPIQMRFNELMTGIRQDVAVKIFGENMDTLAVYAEKVRKIIEGIQGATSPQVERVNGLPQINIEYNRARIANYGLTVKTINDIVSTAFAGKSAGIIYENERQFDLVVRLDSNYRNDINDVKKLPIPINSGNQIPLSQVADVQYKLGPAQISREAGKRRIVIGFNVSDRDVQSLVGEIQTTFEKELKLPSGYYLTYGGQFENLREASNRLKIAVPISLLLIFVLLYFTFRSLKQAILIFTAIPMSAIGGVFALLLRDMPFSISAGIGFIALFGVAVLNGIVLIGTFNQMEKEGMADMLMRVTEGTKTRLRPVLMTALVASLGFLPMAISTGAGAEVQKPLATVVIGGIVTATFLTLFTLPLLYIIVNDFKNKSLIKRKHVVNSIPFLLIAVVSSTYCNAQNIKKITVDDALAMAIQNNIEIKSAELTVQSVDVLKSTVMELPKMNLTTQLGQYNSINFDQAFQISQTIPFPTLFNAKEGLINAEIKRKEWAKQITVNELKSQVRHCYYQIEFLLHNENKLRYLDSLYSEFIMATEVRYKTGDAKKIEISMAETKKGEVNVLLRQNNTDLRNTNKVLQVLLNTNDSLILSISEPYTPLQMQDLMDISTINTHPTVRALYTDMEVAERSGEVEKAMGLPEFTIGYNNQSLIGLQNINGQERYFSASNRFQSINIGITIPLTYSAAKARSESFNLQKKATEMAIDHQHQRLSAQLQNTLHQYRQDRQLYMYYTQQVLPNARQIADAALIGYKAGDISYMEYMLTLQIATDAELKYLQSVQKINQTVININSLINQ